MELAISVVFFGESLGPGCFGVWAWCVCVCVCKGAEHLARFEWKRVLFSGRLYYFYQKVQLFVVQHLVCFEGWWPGLSRFTDN